MTDDEKFFAWLDGELSQSEAAEMEAKVAADPQLRRLADQHGALGAKLRSAFDPIAAAPVPDHLRRAVRPSAEVVEFAATKRVRSMPSLPQWASIAATLAVGIFVGTMVPHRGNGPVEVQGGRLYAAASLNRALDAQLASAPADSVRIGMTFRNHSGEVCRTFTARAASGLACRNGGRWGVKGLFAAPEGQASDYRMAAGMDPNLAALVDSSLVGEPFDENAERSERDKGWR